MLTYLNIGDGREPEKRPVWLHRVVQRPDCLKRPRKVRLRSPFVKQPPTCIYLEYVLHIMYHIMVHTQHMHMLFEMQQHVAGMP